MLRACVNHPDIFYIHAQLAVKSQQLVKHYLTLLVKKNIKKDFGLRNLDKTWTSSVCCAQ